MAIKTTIVEVHGNDGSRLARARNFIRETKCGPGGRIIDATHDTNRCQHGALLIVVTYDDGKDSETS